MPAPAAKPRKQDATPAVFAADGAEAAEEAGLYYVTDDRPGYTRRVNNSDFEYLDAQSKKICDEQRVLRIKRLAIPPAWTDVWICPSPNGHIQATGRDARGRKQLTDAARGCNPVHDRHRDVHQHDLRLEGERLRDRLAPVDGLAHDLDLGLGGQDRAQDAPRFN